MDKFAIVLSSALVCSSAGANIPAPRHQDPPSPSSGQLRAAEDACQSLVDRKYDALAAGFDDTMKKALTADMLRSTWEATVAPYGKVTKVEVTSTTMIGSLARMIRTVHFESGSVAVTVVVNEQGRIAGLFMKPLTGASAAKWTPPAYADATKYEVTETKLAPANQLPLVVTMPKGAGPFPAVVLVHGSGPNDRDESVGGCKPFADLAGGLASRGVAVYRYDKRTKVLPETFKGSYTVEQETTLDAIAAVAQAKQDRRVGSVYLVGHSLAGTMAPRIAARQPALAGIVVLAGSTRKMDDLLRDQFTYLKLPDIDQQIALLHRAVPAAYFADLDAYSPTETAKALDARVRILVLQGERDYQVTMKDFAGWKTALGGQKRATLKTYPDLNHLFVAGHGPSLPAEYERVGHVSLDVIEDIATFVKSAR